MNENLDRAVTLLKAAKELLRKQEQSYYVLNLLEETVFYDDAECDGNCLMEDIEDLLEEIEYETVALARGLPTMDEYIKRATLEKWILTECASLDTKPDREYVVERLKEEIPASDVRPVVRGEWRAKTFHSLYCTNCNDEFDIMKNDISRFNFCPSCGADMRKPQMNEVRTYPEMNEKIVGILRIGDSPVDLYNDSIKVGDEVTVEGFGGTAVVTYLNDDYSDRHAALLFNLGGIEYRPVEKCYKTGRQFPQVKALLKEMSSK